MRPGGKNLKSLEWLPPGKSEGGLVGFVRTPMMGIGRKKKAEMGGGETLAGCDEERGTSIDKRRKFHQPEKIYSSGEQI